MVVPHDILAINGASAALAVSPLPFLGPVGAVRVARIEGELIVNPTYQQRSRSRRSTSSSSARATPSR